MSKKKLKDLIEAKIVSFNKVKVALTSLEYLVYTNPKGRIVYYNVDAYYEFRIRVMLYYIRNSVVLQPREQLKRTEVVPILFLSRLLYPTKKRYYPTELEVAEIVQAIRKCCYIVKLAALLIQVFTNHSAITSIVH